MNPIELLGHLFGFVGLDAADEMPCEVEIAQFIELGESLLQAVFTDVPDSRVRGQLNSVDGNGFGNGNKSDGLGVSICTRRGGVDTILNVSERVHWSSVYRGIVKSNDSCNSEPKLDNSNWTFGTARSFDGCGKDPTKFLVFCD